MGEFLVELVLALKTVDGVGMCLVGDTGVLPTRDQLDDAGVTVTDWLDVKTGVYDDVGLTACHVIGMPTGRWSFRSVADAQDVLAASVAEAVARLLLEA